MEREKIFELARKNASNNNLLEISVPSGYSVVIREQNGDDEGIISNVSMNSDGTAINMFVMGIVVYSPKAASSLGLLSLEEVLAMPIRDKYVILIKSRIYSLGDVLDFTFTWDADVTQGYTETLSRFVWDYNLPFPTKVSDPSYDSERVSPYHIKPQPDGFIYLNSLGEILSDIPTNDPLESEPKILRMTLLNGYGEKKLLTMGETRMNVNSKLIARNISQLIGGNYHVIESFRNFSSKEMALIRKVLVSIDKEFDGLVEITNPVTGETRNIPLLTIPSFFFPQEI